MLEDIDFDELGHVSSSTDRAGGGTIEDYYRTYVLPNDKLVVEFKRKFDGGPFAVSRVWRMSPLPSSPQSDSLIDMLNPPSA